jgi:hypothetical protein
LPSKKGLALAVEKLPVLLAALHQAARTIDLDDGVAEDANSDLLNDDERKYLCDKFGVDPKEFDDILGLQ